MREEPLHVGHKTNGKSERTVFSECVFKKSITFPIFPTYEELNSKKVSKKIQPKAH